MDKVVVNKCEKSFQYRAKLLGEEYEFKITLKNILYYNQLI